MSSQQDPPPPPASNLPPTPSVPLTPPSYRAPAPPSHSASGTVVAPLREVVADLSAQSRNPISMPRPASLYAEAPAPPRVAPVAVDLPEADESNVLDVAIELPIIDAHTHIQGMSLQDASSDPYQRPKWIRRNVRQVAREATVVSSGTLAFIEYSATNDEAVAHMGLKQLNHFVETNKAELMRDDERVHDSVMVTLGMDFGFTPLLCGRGMQGGGGVMTGARMRKRKEKPRHYFLTEARHVVAFEGAAGATDVVDRVREVLSGAGFAAARRSIYLLVERESPAVYRCKRVDTPVMVARLDANTATFEVTGNVGIQVVDAVRRAIEPRGFVTRVGGMTFSPRATLSPVPDRVTNAEYYDDQKVPADMLARAWVRVVDAHYYSNSPDGPPEAFFYLNQKDVYFNNTIEAMWRVASFQAGRIWPLVPYDPRRANALDFVKKAISEKGHVGVKTYTRTFWMPTGNAAMYGPEVGRVLDERNDALFRYLVEEDLPLLNHTSPTGWPAWPVYPEQFTADKTDPLVPPNPWLDASKRAVTSASNATPYRVSWPEVGSIWRKDEDAEGHPTHATYLLAQAKVEAHLKAAGRTATDIARLVTITRVAARVAHYNLYVQLCVAPSAWLPVLRRYPRLRINLAHAGSKLTPYTHYKIKSFKLAEDGLLGTAAKGEVNVMVAPRAKTPADGGRGGFKELFIEAVAHQAALELAAPAPDREAIKALAAEALGTTPWTAWFAAWHARFGDAGWWGDLMAVLRDYPNVYSDFSYYTENGPDMTATLAPIIGEVVNGGPFAEQILKKTMLGSDWFMTQSDGLSSEAYWPLFLNAVKHHFEHGHVDQSALGEAATEWQEDPKYRELWVHWTTLNSLRCYNLRSHGMERMERAYKGFREFIKAREGWHLWYTVETDLRRRGDAWIKALPAWWDKMKEFYDAEVPPPPDAPPPEPPRVQAPPPPEDVPPPPPP